MVNPLPAGIEALIDRAKPPVRSVSICMDADLQAQWDEVSAQLDRADKADRMSLGDTSVHDLAVQVRDLEQAMRDAMVTFRFRGVSMYALAEMRKAYPPAAGQRGNLDLEAAAPELLARSAVEPTMSQDQARRLLEHLSHGQGDKLVTAAWAASTGSVDVPFSARASERTRTPEQ